MILNQGLKLTFLARRVGGLVDLKFRSNWSEVRRPDSGLALAARFLGKIVPVTLNVIELSSDVIIFSY